jgi:transcriptional regulator with XRE-family HTH domain
MPTLGNQLKAAREQKGLSASEAALGTRLKVQHILALEGDDYSTIPAPVYAKGFLRLYAEYLELDPSPLIEEYELHFMPKKRQPLTPQKEKTSSVRKQPEERTRPAGATKEKRKARESVRPAAGPSLRLRLSRSLSALKRQVARRPAIRRPRVEWFRVPARKVATVALGVALLLLAAFGVRACAGTIRSDDAPPSRAPRPSRMDQLIEEPPDPYLPAEETRRAEPGR